MTPPTVSIVVVSRGRPAALKRCLTGIEQLFTQRFEVVIVADPAGCEAVRIMGLADSVKLVEFDEANISSARNVGTNAAAGEIIAFIDDDSVPEPTWLDNLTAPFDDTEVQVAGGYVLGRDGIRFQYRANWVDRAGWTHPIEIDSDQPVKFPADKDRAIKTEGTNFAIRSDAIDTLGGFDTAFAYFLDETDLNIHAADAGMATTIVPQAAVHHGFLASSQRTAQSLPKSLFDIGASATVFLRKHASELDLDSEVSRYRNHQSKMLARHESRGNCSEQHSAEILATFDRGVLEGKSRPFGVLSARYATPPVFKEFIRRREFIGSLWLAGRIWEKRALRAQAERAVNAGNRVTILVFSPSARRHRMHFTDGGYWMQSGGLFGVSSQGDPRFQFTTFRRRLRRELKRLEPHREFTNISENICYTRAPELA